MVDKVKKQALALAFGVVMTSSLISGIPGNINGLTRLLSCGTCKVQMYRGLPIVFADQMTDEQKRIFRRELKRLQKKGK